MFSPTQMQLPQPARILYRILENSGNSEINWNQFNGNVGNSENSRSLELEFSENSEFRNSRNSRILIEFQEFGILENSEFMIREFPEFSRIPNSRILWEFLGIRNSSRIQLNPWNSEFRIRNSEFSRIRILGGRLNCSDCTANQFKSVVERLGVETNMLRVCLVMHSGHDESVRLSNSWEVSFRFRLYP